MSKNSNMVCDALMARGEDKEHHFVHQISAKWSNAVVTIDGRRRVLLIAHFLYDKSCGSCSHTIRFVCCLQQEFADKSSHWVMRKMSAPSRRNTKTDSTTTLVWDVQT